MTKEEKELVLKDLCARLLYGTKIKVRSNDIRTIRMIDMIEGIVYFVESDSISHFGVHIEHPTTFRQVVKPYLRPMSSMTDIEKVIYKSLKEDIDEDYCEIIQLPLIDWLNAHHFDYRGLIEKGLAIEVTKANNPYE